MARGRCYAYNLSVKNIVLGLALLAVIVGGVYWYMQDGEEMSGMLYSSAVYGISFQYPESYELQEREVGNGERYHYSIVLIDKEALANIPQNGEGPPTINVNIFQNNLDQRTVEQWVRSTNDSNFKLSPDGTPVPTTVADTPALSYIVDGLYRSNVVVFAHGDNIIMFNGQWLPWDGQIRADFGRGLASLDMP